MSKSYREDQHVLCASVDTHDSGSAVKSSTDLRPVWCRRLSREGVFACGFVASYGHVLLILDQRDWQSCRSWSGLEITGERP